MELKNGPAGMPGIPVVSHWHNGLSRGGTATMAFQGKRADASSWLKTRSRFKIDVGRQRLKVSIQGRSMGGIVMGSHSGVSPLQGIRCLFQPSR
jgi:hypothetical protein